jgi:hypothetical protein
MPYKSTDYLIKLISRLTPAEKRQFRMSMKNNSQKSDSLYMSLFDHIDKYKSYEEDQILAKVPGIKREQLSNLKSNLYKQLLSALRLQNRSNSININIRENIDYAVILYNKGMYNAALDALDKVKKIALEAKKYSSILTILELEKKIEGLYVTGSMHHKAKQLTKETKEVLKELNINHHLSNLSLSMYGLYLQYGFVKNNKDYDFITDYFKVNLPSISIDELGFYGKLYYYQSHVWYHFMLQDFPNYYRYSTKWIELFEKDHQWIENELTIYIKGYHNVLNAVFMSQRYDKFKTTLQEFLNMGNERLKYMNDDEYSTFILIKSTHEINEFFLNGHYEKAIDYVNNHKEFLLYNELGWDLNRELSSYFKVGCLYFCAGDMDNALLCLNKITNTVYPSFREDIQCFARMLSLIIHFEKGNEILISHQIVSTYRYLSKIEHLQKALASILSFLRKLSKTNENDLKNEFIKLKSNLEAIEGQEFERRPFLYLDIISWLESKIEGVHLQEVLRRKIAAKSN